MQIQAPTLLYFLASQSYRSLCQFNKTIQSTDGGAAMRRKFKGDVAAAQFRETGVDEFTDTDNGMYTQPLIMNNICIIPTSYNIRIQFCTFMWIIYSYSIPGVHAR